MSAKRIFQSKSLIILASLALATGLLGLLWAFMPRSAAEAQVINSDFAAGATNDAIVDGVAFDEAAAVAKTSAIPVSPRDEKPLPNFAPPAGQRRRTPEPATSDFRCSC